MTSEREHLSLSSGVSCRWIDILKQGHAIAQVTRINWTSPGNRHKDVRVGGARRPWSGRAVAAARKDCNVIANVGEQRWRHHRHSHRVNDPRRCLGEADTGRSFVVPAERVDFDVERAPMDHNS